MLLKILMQLSEQAFVILSPLRTELRSVPFLIQRYIWATYQHVFHTQQCDARFWSRLLYIRRRNISLLWKTTPMTLSALSGSQTFLSPLLKLSSVDLLLRYKYSPPSKVPSFSYPPSDLNNTSFNL